MTKRTCQSSWHSLRQDIGDPARLPDLRDTSQESIGQLGSACTRDVLLVGWKLRRVQWTARLAHPSDGLVTQAGHSRDLAMRDQLGRRKQVLRGRPALS